MPPAIVTSSTSQSGSFQLRLTAGDWFMFTRGELHASLRAVPMGWPFSLRRMTAPVHPLSRTALVALPLAILRLSLRFLRLAFASSFFILAWSWS